MLSISQRVLLSWHFSTVDVICAFRSRSETYPGILKDTQSHASLTYITGYAHAYIHLSWSGHVTYVLSSRVSMCVFVSFSCHCQWVCVRLQWQSSGRTRGRNVSPSGTHINTVTTAHKCTETLAWGNSVRCTQTKWLTTQFRRQCNINAIVYKLHPCPGKSKQCG